MNTNKDSSWEEFTKSIKKIDKDKAISKKTPSKIQIKTNIPAPSVTISKDQQQLEIGSFDNIDRNTARKFKRGEFGIEATLDLHGCTEDKAFEMVTNFIKNTYSQEKRSILIITGKGTRKDDDDDFFSSRGVLKDKVPEWLNSSELRPFILSFTHPEQKLGGKGALHILLRRNKNNKNTGS